MGRLKEIVEDRPIPEYFWGLTQAMFYEFRFISSNGNDPIFNMKERDHCGTRSFYQLYMSYDSEYEAAKGILGSWKHWQKLCKCRWFAAQKNIWDEEKNLYLESLAFSTLVREAEAGDLAAARTLITRINKKERDLEKKSRGRPTNKTDNSASALKSDDYELDIMLDRFRAVNENKES